MTPAQLSRTVLHTVRCAAQSGELEIPAPQGFELPQRLVVEAPPRRGSGDYSVSVAFQVAKAAGMAPYDVARVLQARLAEQEGVRSVEIAGGGFLNVTLDDRARAALVAALADSAGEKTANEATANEATANEATANEAIVNEATANDAPAADIARWSAVTGDAPAALAVRTARSSPLFHVQYAHARTRALSRNARDLGFHSDAYAAGAERESPYGTRARALLALLADHRRVSEQADPARHARHLVAVGDAFFDFHDDCPPLPGGDEKPGAAHRARLALVEATGAVLAGGLSQLGVTAPAHL
ncbi:MAG TPA: DALR anticodon-binding domain-containing protein [Streptomyces sp.]|nr:DALR anticodon-binding domain-containing protein [Streptomyces sp.]